MSKNGSLKPVLKETDFFLYLMCIFTSAFGALMVFSATRNNAIEDGILLSRDCLIMIIASGVGIALCLLISFLDYDSLVRLWPFIGGICLLLILLLFPFGDGPSDRPNARCWLPIL